MKTDFILASASPRRIDMLGRLGLRFEAIPAHVEENCVNGESPRDHVIRLARKKAEKIATLRPDTWILAADTVVVLEYKILGKPSDKAEAMRMLDMLSGNVHEVHTGYCFTNQNMRRSEYGHVVSKVKIKTITQKEAEFYTNTKEPYDKAGGYAVQGIGAFMVEEIIGSYTNVVGLPLCQVVSGLEDLGIVDLFSTEFSE